MPGVCRDTGKGPYPRVPGVWKAGVAVQLGDVVFRDTDGYDKPAGSFAWDTDLATTRSAFKDLFRGVAEARRTTAMATDGGRGGDGGMILAGGEFEYPCAALGSAAAAGALVTLAKAAGNALLPQQVEVTTTVAAAIGVVTEDAAVGATALKVRVHPALFDRGVQSIV